MANNPFRARITELQNKLKSNQTFLLSTNSDVFYFSSFANSVPEERSAFLLIGKNNITLILQNFLPIPEFYKDQVLFGCSPNRLTEHLNNLQINDKYTEFYADFSDLRVDEFKVISKALNFPLKQIDRSSIWQLRCQKDKEEVKNIKKALLITENAILATISQLHLGQSELEVKQFIENQIRQHLHADLAFQSIIAFDENSTLPHHQSGQKELSEGSVVLIDAGAKYNNYCADMTRTIFFQSGIKPLDQKLIAKKTEFEKILRLVKNAQTKAKKLLKKPLVSAAEIDQVCRNYLSEAGFGQNFIHTTGHGLGLDIHEPPSLYKTNPKNLSSGMVLTIEPGIYMNGKFGIRWEDTVFY